MSRYRYDGEEISDRRNYRPVVPTGMAKRSLWQGQNVKYPVYWCDQCQCYAISCTKCGNNSCNGNSCIMCAVDFTAFPVEYQQVEDENS